MVDRESTIAIDLGTANLRVAVYRDGDFHIIPNEVGQNSTPAYIAFTQDGILVGSAAKDQAASNAQRTIFDIARLLGQASSLHEMRCDARYWPFTIKIPEVDHYVYDVGPSYPMGVSVEDALSKLFNHAKHIAEEHLATTITSAVVTISCCDTICQRLSIQWAAQSAGLKVKRILRSTSSAAMGYGAKHWANCNAKLFNVMVLDMGAGSLEASIISFEDNIYEVIAVAGGIHAGGNDFDFCLLQHFAKHFNKKNNTDVLKDKRAIRRLRTACEQAKKDLSSNESAKICLESLHNGIDYVSEISRSKFEDISAELFDSIMTFIKNFIQTTSQRIHEDTIKYVLLVGGSSKIPRIRELLRMYLGPETEILSGVDIEEVTVCGASVMSGILSGDQTLSDLLLLECLVLGLGVQMIDNTVAWIIRRHDTIYTRSTGSFTTCYPDQKDVIIQIYEETLFGDSENCLIGVVKFPVKSSHPGDVVIEVTISVDVNSAIDVVIGVPGTNHTVTTTIDRNHRSGARHSLDDMKATIKEHHVRKA